MANQNESPPKIAEEQKKEDQPKQNLPEKDQNQEAQNEEHTIKSTQLALRVTNFLQSESCMRLDASIGSLEAELTIWDELSKQKDDTKKVKMYQNAKNNIALAKKASNIQSAWKYFFRAVCATAYFLEGDDLRNVACATLLESKEKLEDWRRKAVIKLLCDADGNLKKVPTDTGSDKADNNTPLKNHDLYLALDILTEHHNNRYIKIDIAHKQLVLLICSAIVLIILGFLALHYAPPKFEITNSFFLAAVIIFGAIGGTISGLITISRGSTKKKIPDQILSSWSTMSKPIFGALSALAISVFIFAGLVTMTGVVSSSVSIYFVMAVSVLAGFSERFLLSVLRDNDIQHTQKEIVEKLDEVTDKIKNMKPSKNEEEDDTKSEEKT
jgi:hypothetical protein